MIAVFLPILALAVNVLIQVFVYRARRGIRFFASIVEGALCGMIALALFEAALIMHGYGIQPRIIAFLLVDAPTYLALSYCAYNFIQLGQTSIRIRIYLEISESPDGMSAEELKRLYDDEVLTRVRLRRLVEGGDIVERDGRYCIGRSRFLYVSNILFAAKRLLLGKESEFHNPRAAIP